MFYDEEQGELALGLGSSGDGGGVSGRRYEVPEGWTHEGKPCPLCGWPDGLHDDGAVLDSRYPPFDCTNCFFEGTAEELESALEESCRGWWESLETFTRSILESPSGERALFRLGFEMLRRGMSAEVCLEILQRVNETLPRRCEFAEVEEVALRSAEAVAKRSGVRESVSTPANGTGPRFGRPAIERSGR